jgi:secreted trypsin-like serine protease
MSPSWGGFICGASAIHTRWALSAAHCTDRGTAPTLLRLRGGSTNRNDGTVFIVQAYTNHPRYNPQWLDFDIVILQVQAGTPIQGPNIAIIPISPPCNQLCCQACEPEMITVR